MSATGWGILDSDGYWMGGSAGPLVYADELLARAAMTVLYEQFEHRKHFEVAPFTSATRIHDELEAPMTSLAAIKLAEGERQIPRRRPPTTPQESR